MKKIILLFGFMLLLINPCYADPLKQENITIVDYSINGFDLSKDLLKAVSDELKWQSQTVRNFIDVKNLAADQNRSSGFLTTSDSYKYTIVANVVVRDQQGTDHAKEIKCRTTMEDEQLAYRKTVAKMAKEIVSYYKTIK